MHIELRAKLYELGKSALSSSVFPVSASSLLVKIGLVLFYSSISCCDSIDQLQFHIVDLFSNTLSPSIIQSCPQVARQLFGNFRLFSNFQLVEQLSVHRATFKLVYLNSHSHTPATSETVRKCRIYCREYICPIF